MDLLLAVLHLVCFRDDETEACVDVRHSNLFGKLPTADWPLDAYNFIRPIGAWKLGVPSDDLAGT